MAVLKLFGAVLLLIGIGLAMSGCVAATGAEKVIVAPIVQKFGDDLTRTAELADKYARPEVKDCAEFMVSSTRAFQDLSKNLDALEAEPTNGIISDIFKKVLIADALKAQLEVVNQDAFQKGFEDNCSKVSGKIMFAIVRDAAKLAPIPKP